MAKITRALAPFWKAVAAAGGVTLTWYVTAAPDGITQPELAGLALAVGTTLGVFHARNTPS